MNCARLPLLGGIKVGFVRASKEAARLRAAFIGPPGSGKTYSALKVFSKMAKPGQKIALIDTERGSASKYADIFEFDTKTLASGNPKEYISSIREAVSLGFDYLIIDSLSHAWAGTDGALDLVDRAAARSSSGNRFTAWRDVTPLHNELVDTILQCDCHVIATMRTKTDYVMEDDERGKKRPVKVGLAPIQRDGVEYEFDVVGVLDENNTLHISKTRCPALKGADIREPGEELAKTLSDWLGEPNAPSRDNPLASAFRAIGVSVAELEQYLKHPIGACSEEETAHLRDVYAKVRAGYELSDVFRTAALKPTAPKTMAELRRQKRESAVAATAGESSPAANIAAGGEAE